MISLPSQPYISFDIFDTLIKRSVARPTDIFLYMEEYCDRNDISAPPGFAQLRIDAEMTARKKKGGEVTLDDIYDELQLVCGEDVSELKQMEILFELQGCRANPEMAELLARCVCSGKTIVLISDMYLSSRVVSQMLDLCGIHGYKYIYISCEQGCSKRSGLLYKKVLTELNIRPKMLFHYGDNQRSDFLVPQSLGIRTYKVANAQKKLSKVPRAIGKNNGLTYRTVSACAANCMAGENQLFQSGGETFGPLLTGFSLWLRDRLKEDGINDVYFMSRDGFCMKRAFDILEIPGIKTHYLYCSRRAYTVPLLWKHPSFEDVVLNISFYGRMTLSDFILKLGMDPKEFTEEAVGCGLDMNTEVHTSQFFKNPKVRQFYEKIQERVVNNSRSEYDALLDYVLSQHMESKIGVVDIGYYGTMQNALSQLIEEANLNIEIRGYYVGTSPKAELINSNKIIASGYLYSKGRNEDLSECLPASIFETIFLAQHGSVKKFEYHDGHVEPVFYDYEYLEKPDEVKMLVEYQNGAVHFVREYLRSFSKDAIQIPSEVAIYNFRRMVTSPHRWEADLWGDFLFYDVAYWAVAKPKSLTYYMCHWRNFFSDLLHSRWRVGFLYRLIKIPFPYFHAIQFIKRVHHFIMRYD